MNAKALKNYIGKPVKIRKNPDNFILIGFIKAVTGDSVEFQTVQHTSLIDIDEILEVIERKKLPHEEICSNGHVWIPHTAFGTTCPICSCKGCEKEVEK